MSASEGPSWKEVLRDAISIRYRSDLYHHFDRSSFYHFVYAYKRFIVEIAKTLMSFVQPIPVIPSTLTLGLYSTHNQHKALINAVRAGHLHAPLLPLHSLSRKALAIRLIVWSAKLVVYPFMFLQCSHRPSLYQTCLVGGMVAYVRMYERKLEQLGVCRLCISNDHVGDIYILSLLVRGKPGFIADYVQHGAVKPSFPENYFHNIYVYDDKYADIYRTLARNPDVRIVVDPAIAGTGSDDMPAVDVLICFSHQFPLGPSTALIRALSNIKGLTAAVRFHPSDRFCKFKLALLRIFHPVQFSDSQVGYEADFKRAQWIVCASSSLLPDAVEKGYGPRLIWARQLGLNWDYYGLQGKVREVSSAAEVSYLLTHNNAQ